MEPTISELAEMARQIGNLLEKHRIRYHLTGGVVVSYYGEIRNTQDVDIVIDLENGLDTQALFHDLAADFMISRSAFEDALRRNAMFQLLDMRTMLRADIYINGFMPERFDRTVRAEIAPGIFLPILKPEDAILSKLHWIRLGSERSRRDVVTMMKIQTELDRPYLRSTAEALGVAEILDELAGIAEKNDPDIIL